MSEAVANLSIGQVADRTGLSVHALRFYERAGVLPVAVRRGPNGRRVYGEDDLEWLDICIRLRSSGMPLSAIRAYADLVRLGDGTERERLDLLHAHQERVRGSDPGAQGVPRRDQRQGQGVRERAGS